MRSLAGVGVLLLAMAACRPGILEEAGPEAVDRLVVETERGDLLTVGPDGEDPRPLTDDAGPDRRYRQPTWSPDGERIAWAAAERGDVTTGAVLTARPEGGDRTRAPTDFPPFYLAWGPDGGTVAYLSNSLTEGIELGLVDLGDPERARVLASGQPFYLAWSPDGERLLTHVGTDELSILSLDGARREVGPLPGLFQAPVWGAGGRLVYAVREEDAQRLVVADPEGGPEREVVRYRGAARFVLAPGGDRLAYTVGAGRTPEPGVRAALGQPAPSPLTVLDLETGAEHTAFEGLAVAFFWSPDGSSLLVLAGEVDEGGRPWLRWHVRRDGEGPAFARFRPSAVLARDYLPFFDQYAQSLTFWAPDGSAFVYAGRHEAGEEGIWVQPVTEGAAPRRVSEGVLAAWSPR